MIKENLQKIYGGLFYGHSVDDKRQLDLNRMMG
jgi:hypothetical protein